MANIFKPPCDEGFARCSQSAPACPRSVAPWVLAATIIGSSMAFIDGTVVNVALPVLQSELGATVMDVQWVVEAYALLLSSLILVGGSMGDRFGRRRIFAIGIAVFALASVLCGFSQNVTQLIFFRAVQGIGGALLVPGSLAIIGAHFNQEQRGQAIGTWSGFSAITTALGPVVGGWMIEQASWRWIFFLNAPLAVIVLLILYLRVPESRDERIGGKLDLWGGALATLGLGAIIYGLIESAHLSFTNPLVFGTLVFGALMLSAFVVVQMRIDSPMMPLTLFRSKTFSGANLVTLFLYAPLGGALFFVPFNLIQVQGYSPMEAGAAFLPIILFIFILSRWSGGLVERYGAKLPLIVGPLIAALGYMLFTIPGIGGSYWTTFFPPMAVLGLGMAVSVAPLTTAVMGSVETRHTGVASGINNAVARTAGLLAIAVLGIFTLSLFNSRLDSHIEALEIPTEIRQHLDGERIKLAAAELPENVGEALRPQLHHAINDSFVHSMRIIMYIAAGLALVSALVAQMMIEDTKPKEDTG